MNETEKKLKIKLKKLLSGGLWTVKQFHTITESSEMEIKILFENLPGTLIWDFFSPNQINDLKFIEKSSKEIKLVSTGMDDVVWTYILINSK